MVMFGTKLGVCRLKDLLRNPIHGNMWNQAKRMQLAIPLPFYNGILKIQRAYA